MGHKREDVNSLQGEALWHQLASGNLSPNLAGRSSGPLPEGVGHGKCVEVAHHGQVWEVKAGLVFCLEVRLELLRSSCLVGRGEPECKAGAGQQGWDYWGETGPSTHQSTSPCTQWKGKRARKWKWGASWPLTPRSILEHPLLAKTRIASAGKDVYRVRTTEQGKEGWFGDEALNDEYKDKILNSPPLFLLSFHIYPCTYIWIRATKNNSMFPSNNMLLSYIQRYHPLPKVRHIFPRVIVSTVIDYHILHIIFNSCLRLTEKLGIQNSHMPYTQVSTWLTLH